MLAVEWRFEVRLPWTALLVALALALLSATGMAANAPPQPYAGQFTPPHYDSGYDANGNGLYDYLIVNASISVDVSDNYTVAGLLHDANFLLFLFASTSVFLDPGSYVMFLFYSGPAINQSGVDGPYTVDLSLYDSAFNFLDSDTHTTQAYRHTDFDGPPLEFSPPHSDSGLDTDGDGRFNVLNVAANMTVHTAGTYYTVGFLHDANFNLALQSSSTDDLEVGPQTVVLPFSGDALNASGIDGPYFVELGVYDTVAFQQIDSDQHTTAGYSHLEFEEPPSIMSRYTTAVPTIDGGFAASEWADAHVENLTAIPGNAVPAHLLVMNDDQFLYIGYDAIGDTTEEPSDVASIAFDTGNDGIGTSGHEDEFVQGGWAPNEQAHFAFTSGVNWTLHDSPYDTGLPNHAGLASAWGFGSSSAGSTDHRIYEFKIPLALLGAAPGETLGFFGGSHPAPGVYDNSIRAWSVWPYWTSGPVPLASYGDLVVAPLPDTVPPTVSITSPGPGETLASGTVTVTWTASDTGSGLDHFELQIDGGAPFTRPADATSYVATGLSDGPHTFTVAAFDVAGNSQPASVSFAVDTTAPQVTITAPEPGVVGTDSVVVTWTGSDAGSGLAEIEVSLDGGSQVRLSATATTHTFTGVSDGSHTIRVTAIDGVGNAGTATVSVTVDTTEPQLDVVSPSPGGVITASQITAVFSAEDATSGVDRVEISVDGGPVQTLPGTATSQAITGLADGPHTLTVTAFDGAGNSATTTVSFRVDTSFVSPSGPYGVGGIAAIAIIVVAAIAGALLLWRKRKGSSPPLPPPPR